MYKIKGLLNMKRYSDSLLVKEESNNYDFLIDWQSLGKSTLLTLITAGGEGTEKSSLPSIGGKIEIVKPLQEAVW